MGRLILYGMIRVFPFSGCFVEMWWDSHLWLTPVNNPKTGRRCLYCEPELSMTLFFISFVIQGQQGRILFFFFKCCYDFTDTRLGKWSCSPAFMRILRKQIAWIVLDMQRIHLCGLLPLFWCVIGVLVTMLFIPYINLGRSISFPLFKSYFALKDFETRSWPWRSRALALHQWGGGARRNKICNSHLKTSISYKWQKMNVDINN